MQNPRLATRYAKSIIDVAVEQNQLQAVYNDMKLVTAVCKSNADFVAVLRSPIIKADKKGKILAATINPHVGNITAGFITLLINKGREANLPEIAQACIEQYNTIKGISKVKITTAVAINDDTKNAIVASIKASSNQQLEIETVVNEDLIGGFLLETGGNLVDASILRDLKDISKQFLNNDYIHKIR
jgi:F-type H+-transporting ATPase subunit delta